MYSYDCGCLNMPLLKRQKCKTSVQKPEMVYFKLSYIRSGDAASYKFYRFPKDDQLRSLCNTFVYAWLDRNFVLEHIPTSFSETHKILTGVTLRLNLY